MGEQRGPGPDDLVIDGIWVGEPEGSGAEAVVAGCLLAVVIFLSIPPLAWLALAAGEPGPGSEEGSPGAALAWGVMFLWFTVAMWLVFALVVSMAYLLGRSMVVAMLGFEAVYLVLVALIAIAG